MGLRIVDSCFLNKRTTIHIQKVRNISLMLLLFPIAVLSLLYPGSDTSFIAPGNRHRRILNILQTVTCWGDYRRSLDL
jgi:hypothetical protein